LLGFIIKGWTHFLEVFCFITAIMKQGKGGVLTKKSQKLLENHHLLIFIVCPKGMMAHFFLVVNHETE